MIIFTRAILPALPWLLFGLTGMISACSESATATGTGLQPATNQRQSFVAFGHEQPLTEQQLTRLFYLSWPQSHDAIASLLGQPHQTNPGVAESYLMGNGHYATIHYQGGTATGYSLDDSGAY